MTSMARNGHASEEQTSEQTVICVFCGSNPGRSPAHLAAARALAHAFAAHDIKLVYGGGTVGIMGEVARVLVSLRGPDSVHGVIPEALVRYERAGRPPSDAAAAAAASNTHTTATTDTIVADSTSSSANESSGKPPDSAHESLFGRTTVVTSMHERKHLMAQEVIAGGPGSGFVALSGGYGTLEELMEVTTWNQLGIHDRGVCVFNVEGYYDGLMQWIGGAVEAGFVGEGTAGIVKEAHTAEEVVGCLREYESAEGRLKLDWETK